MDRRPRIGARAGKKHAAARGDISVSSSSSGNGTHTGKFPIGQFQRWAAALFHPDDDVDKLRTAFKVDNIRYAVWQLEKTKEGDVNAGRPHLQWYVETHRKLTYAQFKKQMFAYEEFTHSAHIEHAMKCEKANTRYCSKEKNDDGSDARWPGETGFVTFGRSTGYGNKTEEPESDKPKPFAELVSLIHQRIPLFSIEFDPKYEHLRPLIAFHHKKLVDLESRVTMKFLDPCRPVSLCCFYGPSGTGKSTYVRNMYKVDFHYHVYRITPGMGSTFMDGLQPHHKVLWFEDFFDSIPVGKMLGYIDEMYDRLQVKGSSVVGTYNTIIITSNKHPSEFWGFGDPFCTVDKDIMAAFLSRFKSDGQTNIFFFPGDDLRNYRPSNDMFKSTNPEFVPIELERHPLPRGERD